MRGMFAALFLGVLTTTFASAADRHPNCNDNRGNAMQVDNERVLHLKKSTKNQFKDRAYITGVLVGVLKDRKSHLHLDVFIGETQSGRGKDSDIEIIYNRAFDAIDGRQMRPGMEVSACGDFINSFEQAGRYPPSPVGAIIHWTHMAPRPPHQHGFMVVDGRLYGMTDPQDRAGFLDASVFDFWKIAN